MGGFFKTTTMKTAIHQMIEDLKDNGFEVENLSIMSKYLELEKEQIIDSFVECWKANMPDGYECKLSAKEYYNQTYNKNK